MKVSDSTQPSLHTGKRLFLVQKLEHGIVVHRGGEAGSQEHQLAGMNPRRYLAICMRQGQVIMVLPPRGEGEARKRAC